MIQESMLGMIEDDEEDETMSVTSTDGGTDNAGELETTIITESIDGPDLKLLAAVGLGLIALWVVLK